MKSIHLSARNLTHLICSSLLSMGLVGTVLAATPASNAVSKTTKVYTDPFSYCKAVGTIDKPDMRYGGPALPSVIITSLQKSWGLPADTDDFMWKNGTTWRCMDGDVYACTVGANLPCSTKVDLSKKPTSGMTEYCKQNPNTDFIPAYVTGHNNAYEWACAKGKPTITAQAAKPDSQGFNAGIWYQVKP
jgi:hypothetical protein